MLWILGIALAFVVGAGLGGYFTFNRTVGVFFSDALELDSYAIRRYVGVLESMRAGEHDQAAEMLESWLDDVLVIVMEPANYEYPIETATVARVDSAYFAARDYREAFPRTSERGFVDEMVTNVWEAGPPSEFP
jgi:hypothetical protein